MIGGGWGSFVVLIGAGWGGFVGGRGFVGCGLRWGESERGEEVLDVPWAGWGLELWGVFGWFDESDGLEDGDGFTDRMR